MKRPEPKRVSWVGFFASGLTILGGFLISLTVVWVSSDAPSRDTALLVVLFAAITAIPIWAMSKPKDPLAIKVRRRWRWPWRRAKKRSDRAREMWKRKRGQSQNKPFGTPDLSQPSTFVRTPRKPTGP